MAALDLTPAGADRVADQQADHEAGPATASLVHAIADAIEEATEAINGEPSGIGDLLAGAALRAAGEALTSAPEVLVTALAKVMAHRHVEAACGSVSADLWEDTPSAHALWRKDARDALEALAQVLGEHSGHGSRQA